METAVVVRVEPGVAWVQMTGTDACNGCGAKLVCKPGSGGTKELAVSNELGAVVNQQVEIVETNRITLKLSLMQFGLPLFGLLLGINLAAQFPAPFVAELWQTICGVILMLLAGSVTYFWSQQVARRGPAFQVKTVLPTTL